MSGIVNKVKEALHGDKHHEGTHTHDNRATQGENFSGQQAPEGTYGTHNSRMANAADPRIDSDNDNSRTVGNTGATGTAGQYGNTGNTFGSSGRNEFGSSGMTGTGRSEFGSTGTTGTGRNEFGSTGMTGTGRNELGSTGMTGTGRNEFGSTGMTGTGRNEFGTGSAPEGTHGPHSSRIANAADPRVDSDRDGSRTMNPGYGSGPAPNTAGPHKSDMLNKADPRVDSDMDGSRTLGNNNNNNTYSSEGTSNNQIRDPLDAAQAPPSVLRQHLGDPTIHHDDDAHNRDGRHRKMSHQEQFSGI